MAGESSATSFGDLVAAGLLAVGDGYRAKNEELGDTGPVFLRSAYLQDSGWTLVDPDRLANPHVRDFGTKIARSLDTVLTTKGNSLGRLGLVREDVVGAVYSPHLSYWRSLQHSAIDPLFLYYWAWSPEAQQQIKARSESTDMAPYLSLADQLALKLALPEIKRQATIGRILGSLDDKIELNRRMAATLEAMARALFKSWFVDFDPVRANSEGRPTGLPAATAAMFPDAFDDDGLPVGWQQRPFGDVFEIRNGNTPSTDEARYWGGVHYWATPKDLSPLKSPVLLETARTLTDDGVAVVNSGLLPAGSVLISTRAPIGYLAIATSPVAINQGMAGIVGKGLSTAFAWLWCSANIDTFLAVAGGSTFPEISKGTLRKLPMVVPTADVSTAFAVCVDPLVARLVELARESDRLATMRDVLLPRLISGELRIKDGAAKGEAA